MAIEQIFLQGGALVAICIIAYTFARHLTSLNKCMFERTDELVKNHLAHNSEALQKLQATVGELVNVVRCLSDSDKNTQQKTKV